MEEPPSSPGEFWRAVVRWLRAPVDVLGYLATRHKGIAHLLAGVALAVGGGLLNQSWWWVLLILSGLGVTAAGLRWERVERSAGYRVDARDRLFEEDLASLLDTAATIAGLSRAKRIAESRAASGRAVSSLRNAFDDVSGVRVVVFQVSDDGQRMTPEFRAGRQQRPGPFERGTERGDKAFDVLNHSRERTVTVEDLHAASPGEWAGSGDGYATFISAPIRSETEGFGLLTVDAAAPGTLDESHAASIAMFAACLAVLFAEMARGKHSTGYDEDAAREEKRNG